MFKRGIAVLFTVVIGAGVLSGSPGQQAGATTAPAATTTAATFPGSNGRIAYVKEWTVSGTPGPDARADIYTVRPDGTGNQRLTFSRNSQNPIWSPTGGRIAFERPGGVWVMKGDGTGKQRLTDGRLVGWMPVGGRILVARGLGQDGVDPTWWLHRIATGDEKEMPIDLPLVAGLDEPYDDYSEWSYASSPTLSPDGEVLALMLWRPDSSDGYSYDFGSIFTVGLDGTGLTRLPKYSYSWMVSGWAPGGGQLLYWTEEPRGYCASSVRSIRLDGSPGSVNIEKRCAQSGPAWSPDGRRIVFTSGRSNSLQIASKDGALNRNVLRQTEGVYRTQPDWRPVR